MVGNKYSLAAASLALLIVGSAFAVLYGSNNRVSAAASISRSYMVAAGVEVVPGTLVSLDQKRVGYVTPANRDNAGKLVGVIVRDSKAPAAKTGDSTVEVGITGSVSALVTTLNGDITIGNEIGVSPFSGIGSASEPGIRIIGIAQSNLSSSTEGLASRTILDKMGNPRTVYVGTVQVDIAIGPPTKTAVVADQTGLQRRVQSVLGRNVSTTRLIIAALIGLVATLAVVVLTYSSVHAALVSVGRNPYAKQSIYRTLLAIFGLVAVIAIVAIVAMTLLLR